MKHVIFCADDYGQNPTISQAIIELLGKNRLSATSCLVTFPDWLEQAKHLQPFKQTADLGLHFNLTEGQPLSSDFSKRYGDFLSLPALLQAAFLRRLKPALIEKELNAQLDRYVEGMGQLPRFLDGHQHVHHFPVIREVVLKVYEQRLRSVNAYIRCVHDANALWRGSFKGLIIELTGAYALKNALVKYQIPHNRSFAGIYNFADTQKYADRFPVFLQQIKNGGLIMCHPGLKNSDEKDLISAARFQEFQYFSGREFAEVCQKNEIVIARLNNPIAG